MEKIEYEADLISLKDLLKATNIIQTGGMAKAIIRQEGVSLNGEKCFIAGKKLRKGDEIIFDNYLIKIV